MPRGAAEVADVFRRYGDAYRQQHGALLSTAQRRVMTAIERCRTAALVGLQPTGLTRGGHVEQCDACGHQRICYNSCRIATAQSASPGPVPSGWRTADPSS